MRLVTLDRAGPQGSGRKQPDPLTHANPCTVTGISVSVATPGGAEAIVEFAVGAARLFARDEPDRSRVTAITC